MSLKSAVVVIIRDAAGRFLIGKRSAGKPVGGGYWCPVAGSVQEGESETGAVAREALEEVGLVVEPVRKLTSFPAENANYLLNVWEAQIVSGECRVSNDEHTELRWVTIEEARALTPHFAEDLAVMERLAAPPVAEKPLALLDALLDFEVEENKFRYHALENFLGVRTTPLEIAHAEGSVFQAPSDHEPELKGFNQVHVQRTSHTALQQGLEAMLATGREPLVITYPIGLDANAYGVLASHGYSVFDVRSLLHRPLDGPLEPPPNPSIEVKVAYEQQDFKDAHAVLCSHSPIAWEAFGKSYLSHLVHHERSSLYVAYIGDDPAAIGVLSWAGGTGRLSSGVADPRFRGHGIQKALIRHRIHACYKLGLKRLFAPGVPPFSASEANLRACGFQVLCNRSFWKRPKA